MPPRAQVVPRQAHVTIGFCSKTLLDPPPCQVFGRALLPGPHRFRPAPTVSWVQFCGEPNHALSVSVRPQGFSFTGLPDGPRARARTRSSAL